MMDSNPTSSRDRSGLPLAPLLVIDVTVARAGPTCVRHLADWGADVIRIERPDARGEQVVGARDGSDYQNLHRNKRVMSLDLKSPEGHRVFLELVRRADIVVENMRVAVKHRLGIAWEDLRPINPRLIYGSISGFGQSGPYGERAGVDQIAQGMGGLMSVTGEPGRGPMRAGIAVADLTAGNLLAMAIMMALYERERTGQGRWVHTSLLESQVFMLDFQAARWLLDKEIPGQVGNDHPTLIPMGVFPTSDGHINLAASSFEQFKRLCDVLGKPEWCNRPEWRAQRGRSQHRVEIHAAIAEQTQHQPSAYWVERMERAGLPCGPIYAMDQVFEDPQVMHLQLAAAVDHPRRGQTHLVNSPVNLAGIEKRVRSAAPAPAEHTREVLEWLGYSATEIDALRASRAI